MGSQIVLAVGLVVVASAFGADESPCASCHDVGPKVAQSAHAAVTCGTCHEKHDRYPHPAKVVKPACAACHGSESRGFELGVHGLQRKKGDESAPDCSVCHGTAHEVKKPASVEFQKGIVETCGMCHNNEAAEFQKSIHGKALAQGLMDAPSCNDCHGEHQIQRVKSAASPVQGRNERDTCARCHADVRLSSRFGLPPDRVASFDLSFHGLALQSGSQTVASCGSCHGIHNILPSSDPASTISPKNLPTTCGRCHPGAGSRFALGTIHWTDKSAEPEGVRWVRLTYALLIPGLLGYMLLHNGADWARKLWHLRLRPQAITGMRIKPGSREIRMMPFERILHAGLAISFVVLSWTGFALKYPDGWWARPLLIWESTNAFRGVIHRVAAVIFLIVSAMHVVSLVASKPLRKRWMEMLPRGRDLVEGVQNLLWLLGLRGQKPKISSHSYIEKMEYWAVVWGAFVMAATGVVLWANTLALHYLPKAWLDIFTAIHFYEAVLATAAIVVWHFYFVMFDPEVYPLDPAFLTGYSPRHRDEHLGHPPRRPGGSAAHD